MKESNPNKCEITRDKQFYTPNLHKDPTRPATIKAYYTLKEIIFNVLNISPKCYVLFGGIQHFICILLVDMI